MGFDLALYLQQIADETVAILVELPLEPDAELGINSATDWYTHRLPIALRAT